MFTLVRYKNQVPHNHENGFTLIEVMVALAIFVIGIIGIYQLQVKSTYTNALANHVGTAATWATYTVEQLLATDYDDLNDDGTGGAGSAGLDDTEGNADGVLYIRPNGSTGTATAAGDLYSVSWNIAEGTAAGIGQPVLVGTKQIRVIVIKKGGIGKGTLYTHDYFKTSATF